MPETGRVEESSGLLPGRAHFLFRILALTWAAASALAALGTLYEHEMAGFPDGHLTDYEQAIATPLLILAILCFAQSLYFAYAALRRRPIAGGWLGFGFGIGSAALLLVVPLLLMPICPHLPLCRDPIVSLGIAFPDHGIGG